MNDEVTFTLIGTDPMGMFVTVGCDTRDQAMGIRYDLFKHGYFFTSLEWEDEEGHTDRESFVWGAITDEDVRSI